MEKTTLRSLFLLTIITGSIFTLTACGPDITPPGEVKETPKVEQTEKVPGDATKKDETKAPTKVEDAIKSEVPVKTEVPVKAEATVTAKTEAPVVKPEPVVSVTQYKDGSYTRTGSYQSPGGQDSVTVTVSLKNDVVESVSFGNGGSNEASINFQNLFIAGVNSQVVGKKLADISVGVVNGSSLTGVGFNQAVSQIQTAALR